MSSPLLRNVAGFNPASPVQPAARALQGDATMKLSLFSDYALRVLIFAALKGESFRVDEVTQAYGISRNHLAKVIHRLAQLGYLRTRRGRGGGIELARTPESIRIGRLVRETEDQPVMVECFDPATNTCPIAGSCRLKGVLAEASNAFFDTLDQHTLDELVRGTSRNRLQKILLPAAGS